MTPESQHHVCVGEHSGSARCKAGFFKTFTVRCDNVEGKEEDATGGAERMSFDVAES